MPPEMDKLGERAHEEVTDRDRSVAGEVHVDDADPGAKMIGDQKPVRRPDLGAHPRAPARLSRIGGECLFCRFAHEALTELREAGIQALVEAGELSSGDAGCAEQILSLELRV